MKTRIRLSKDVISSRAEAETALGEIAAATADLNQLTSEMDARLTEIRQHYESTIDALKKSIELKSGCLKAWAESAPEEFGDRKSIDLLHGRLGFRTGNPKLKTLAGWTWERVKDQLESIWIRVKEEVDKEGLLGAYARGEIAEPELRKIGLRVVQDEAFFIEPKLEEAAGKVVEKS